MTKTKLISNADSEDQQLPEATHLNPPVAPLKLRERQLPTATQCLETLFHSQVKSSGISF